MSKAIEKSASNKGRYREVTLSIVVFLLIIIVILGFTFFATFKVNKNTTAINTAGQLRDLTQSVTRDLFDMKLSYGEDFKSPHISSTLKRMQSSIDKITEDLNNFQHGGDVTVLSGKVSTLDALTVEGDIQLLKTTQQEWELYGSLLKDYLASATDFAMDSTPLDLAVNQAQGSSIAMYRLLDELTQSIRDQGQSQAEWLRIIQIVGVVIVLMYFFIFVFYFMRKLGLLDRLADKARKETADILNTVNEGLFLVDESLTIGDQHSASLGGILGGARVAGRSLVDLLTTIVSKKDLESTKSFIGLLFDKRKKVRLMQELNPLDRVETQVTDSEGHIDTRYLNFNFTRVYEDNEITRILVGVSDITEKIELEKRLEREEIQNNQQLEMLSSILHTDMNMLKEFLKHADKCSDKINEILKNPVTTQIALKQKLKDIFVEVHSLKGEASALKLGMFVETTNEFEENLKNLTNKEKVTGNDFLSLVIVLDKLIDTTARINEIINRLGGFVKKDARPDGLSEKTLPMSQDDTTADQLSLYFSQFVEDISLRQDKKTNLIVTGLTEIDSDLAPAIKDITTQIVRNAIVHGIEHPNERLQQGKPETGTVKIGYTRTESGSVLIIEDDGSGIDFDKIRQKLRQNNLKTTEEVQEMSARELIAAMFSSGFSTASNVDEDAGRGVGLGIIRERLRAIGGSIQIGTQRGKYTKFTIQIPI